MSKQSLLLFDRIEQSKHSSLGRGKTLKASQVKSKSQTTALEILKREEANAKLSRLECLLVQQYISKYGSKQANSRINSFIKATVSEFFHNVKDARVVESEIDGLENQVRELTTNMRLQIQNSKTTSKSDEPVSSRSTSAPYKKPENNERNGKQRNPFADSIDPNQWPVLNAIMALSDEEKQYLEKAQEHEKRIKFKQQLDTQLVDQKMRARKKENDDVAFVNKMKEDRELLEKEHAQARMRKEESYVTERTSRLAQIQERQSVRDREREIKILHEQNEMARARRLLEEEEERKQKKKDEQKKAQEAMKIENEYNKALKAEAKMKQWEYEASLNKQYEAKLDKEEKARADALQSRLDVLKKAELKYASQTGAKLEQEKASVEQKTFAAIEAKDREDAERERLKAEKRKREQQRSKEFNEILIERKRNEREQEKQDAIRRRQQLEQDVQKMEEAERAKIEARKLKMIEVKMELDRQVQHKQKSVTNSAQLNEEEIRFNKAIIAKVTQNPEVFMKIVDKVKPLPRNGQSSEKLW